MSIARIEKHNYTVESLTQWDRNQVLEIHGLSLARAPEVHFSNVAMERAISRQSTMDSAGVITVSVPNGLLQKPYTIMAHLCLYTGATFETLYTLKIPVTERKQPADYTIEDDGDVYSFNALNNKVSQALEDMKKAEQSMGERLGPLVAESVGESVGALIDTSLSQEGKAADAKAVTDAFNAFKTMLSSTSLWTNPDDTVAFAATTIPIDLAVYPRIRIIWNDISTSTKGKFETVHTRKDKYIVRRGDSRVVFTVTNDGIVFSTTGSEIPKYQTPTEIIGYTY